MPPDPSRTIVAGATMNATTQIVLLVLGAAGLAVLAFVAATIVLI